MPAEETCMHGATPLTCGECTDALVLTDPVARQAYRENLTARVRADERAAIVRWLRMAKGESAPHVHKLADLIEMGAHWYEPKRG